MVTTRRQNAIGSVVALTAISAVTFVYKQVITEVNTTTVALSLLLIVLAAASRYGLGPSIVASVAGMLCFNFFFLPPFGTLTIEKPEDWVALAAFLVTAVTASQLSSAARARARDADRRREEVMRLYQLSRAIMATPDSETAVSSIARQVVEVFQFEYCAIFVPEIEGAWQRLAAAGDQSFAPSQAGIERVFTTGEVEASPIANGRVVQAGVSEHSRRITHAPLKIGVRPTGVLVLVSFALERGTVEAIAGLVALAIERARFLKEVSRTEALRQSDELKSAILASVSHDLRTPLTAIRAAVDSLLEERIQWDRDALREFHLIISEEVQRLTRLVQNLLEMARIEAGELKPDKKWGSISEIFSNVLERTSSITCNHRVVVALDESAPLVKVDSRLIAEALSNLVENAAKYSPPGSEIAITGQAEEGMLIISVKDRGEGIAIDQQSRIFEKFYRVNRPGRMQREGTGMGLAIVRGVVEAHGGVIRVESAPGCGATFVFEIPVELRTESAPAMATESY